MIQIFDRKVLTDAGTVSHAQAMKRVEVQYRKYHTQTKSEVERAYLDNLTTERKS